jgi:hypothetical protein
MLQEVMIPRIADEKVHGRDCEISRNTVAQERDKHTTGDGINETGGPTSGKVRRMMKRVSETIVTPDGTTGGGGGPDGSRRTGGLSRFKSDAKGGEAKGVSNPTISECAPRGSRRKSELVL